MYIAIESPCFPHQKKRFGHPSLSKHQQMIMTYMSHKVESLSCESCQLGKHVHISFSSAAQSQAVFRVVVIHF